MVFLVKYSTLLLIPVNSKDLIIQVLGTLSKPSYYYYYHRISHFSALAGKYSPILGCIIITIIIIIIIIIVTIIMGLLCRKFL